MRTEVKMPRRKWPWILVGSVAVIAALVAGSVWYSNSRTPAASSAAPSSTPTTAVSGSPATDPAPTGCLGGKNRDAAMVLAAQKAAPHTSNGAVEFATAFLRWSAQYPYPTAQEAADVQAHALSPTTAKKVDLATGFSSKPNLSGGSVPDVTPYYFNSVSGVYLIESFSDKSASVSIGLQPVVNGELKLSQGFSSTVDVEWSSVGWQFVSSGATRGVSDLFASGKTFSGGC